MDPASAFKFACPVCGQHLQARAEEAGRTTECPSCFKKLTVPQAPTGSGTKLIITASLADTRRMPSRSGPPPAPVDPVGRVSNRSRVVWLAALVAVAVVVIGGVLVLRRDRLPPAEATPSPGGAASVEPGLWTNDMAGLRLLDAPVKGRLNGWAFDMNTVFWRDTRLVLRQNGGEPEGLRLAIDFPIKGGELVAGKTFRVGPGDPPFEVPLRVIWKNAANRDTEKRFGSGYLLWVEFDAVSGSEVGGRIHLCLPDPERSWLAGRFKAENRTKPR